MKFNLLKLRNRLRRYEYIGNSEKYNQTVFDIGNHLGIFEDYEIRVFKNEGYIFKHSMNKISTVISRGEL
jgi:hypothetical protein